MSSVTPLEHQEMNLNPDYWMKKFLYPFSLDPAPIRINDYPVQGVTLGGQAGLSSEAVTNTKTKATESVNILETDRFNFPISHIDGK